MEIGLTYDLREEHPSRGNAPPDYYAEFDTQENIDHLEAAIASLGYRVRRIGNLERLMRFLVEGESVDIVFNMAEGLWGRSREAQVPAILEAYRIPYTGSDPLTLTLCLDKSITKRLWQSEGLPTPDFAIVSDSAELDRAHKDLPNFPLFVKPAYEGSSKGVSLESIVETDHELYERVEWALALYRQPALIETFLPGREFTVGILGGGREARALGVAEVATIAQVVVNSFTHKQEWTESAQDKFVPVESAPLRDRLSELALQAYLVLGCQDVGRVDIRLDKDDNPQLLEVNPIVGLHPTHAALPIIGVQAGVSYEALIAEILQHAIRRWSL
jgi:D-alanine-D-alanine ligase